MLLGEILSNIRLRLTKEYFLDSSLIRPRQIYFTLIRKRATVIENRYRDDQKLSRNNFQTIACAKLVRSAPADCDCIDLDDCLFYRTACKLPRTLTNYVNNEVETVTSIDGSIVFIKTDWVNFSRIKYRRYTKNMPFFAVYNDYIYVVNNIIDGEPIEYISFTLLAQDPIKALECNACTGVTGSTIPNNLEGIKLPLCDSIYDYEFPLTGKLLDSAVQLTLQELADNYAKEIGDAYNRSTDLQSDLI